MAEQETLNFKVQGSTPWQPTFYPHLLKHPTLTLLLFAFPFNVVIQLGQSPQAIRWMERVCIITRQLPILRKSLIDPIST